MPVLLTRVEVAALPDLPGQSGPVHPMTVTKWERAGLPIAARGRKGKASKYDEAAVRAWLQAREDAAASPGAALDLVQERAKKEHWQALVAEQTYRTRERELLPRAEVEKAWAAEVSAVRARLLAWPQTLADRVHRVATLENVAAVERALDEAVREVLTELSGLVAQPEQKPRVKRRRRAA